ncbi:MAG: peptidyl-prolyl cis-trans isomerase [Acetobacteraceae bacterium]|jgi:peptidyl-prolyl cis-trans isomerase C|nr:peptidyl-prolyl cis-trans isomerase [Acetobacteraceae bacterium]
MGDRATPLRATCGPVSARRMGLASCLATLLFAGGSACFAQTGAAAAPPPPTTPATQVSTPGSLAELAAQFEKSPDTVVADVGGTPLTLGMVADRLHEFPEKFAVLPTPLIYHAALDDLIQQRSLAVKAKELGLDKSAETQRRSGEATDRALGQALMQRIIPELVTDKAIEDRYNATIAGKPGAEEVRFRVIATATEADAIIVLEVLSKGTGFDALAQKVSKDPSGFNGGEIGYARRDSLTPEIGAVVFALVPGQTTAFPVRSNGLWFVLQVEARRQQGTPSLAESKATLTADLTRDASAEILRKTRAAVVVNDYGPSGMRGHAETTVPKSH